MTTPFLTSISISIFGQKSQLLTKTKTNPIKINFLGTFYPTSMKIRPDGRLVVRFKTVARFNGMFVLNHPGR